MTSAMLADHLARLHREEISSWDGDVEVGYPVSADDPAMLLVKLPDSCRAHADELIPELTFQEVFALTVQAVEDRGITE